MSDEIEARREYTETLQSAIEDIKKAILAELKRKDPLWWKMTQVIVPIALTTILGFVVWTFQASIEETIDDKARLLNAQMGLVQSLYEARLDAYRALYEKALAIHRHEQDSRSQSPQAQEERKELHAALKILSELQSENKILASTELNSLLFTTWLNVARGQSPESSEKLLQEIEEQMRRDLFVDRLSPGAVFIER